VAAKVAPPPVHPVIAAMNVMRYDAAVLGNHEFNYGVPALRAAIDKAAFPFVAANVRDARGRPFDLEAVSKRHFHDVKFQMVYVLKGWNRVEFEGQGEHMMVAGSCWIQPAGIKHTVLEYSDDLEVLEIIIPGSFDTVTVDEPPGFD
jgi:hypothetical protein